MPNTKRTMVTFTVQTTIHYTNENNYLKKLNNLITKLEKYSENGSVDVMSEDEEDDEDIE